MLICALYQNRVKIKGLLNLPQKKRKIRFLPFSNFIQLETLIRKHILDLVVIAGDGSFAKELNLARRMKKHPILSLIPLVLYHPENHMKIVLTGYSYGADEFFSSKTDRKLMSAKLNMIIHRSRRDLGVNPTTRLPGTSIIERDITRRIKNGEEFAACYADLDNFKAYNDITDTNSETA